MQVAIASLNPTKVGAVQAVLPLSFPQAELVTISVESEVSHQPLSEEETKQGAINRSKNALRQASVDVAIGLEGGVYIDEEKLFLCNWGAITDRAGALYLAGGAKIELPTEFIPELLEGKELCNLCDAYFKTQNIRSHGGAIGALTKDMVNRQEMFIHIMKLLLGQYCYWTNQLQLK